MAKSKRPKGTLAPSNPAARRKVIEERVLLMFAAVYGDASLRMDPDDRDRDPGPFYQAIKETFDLEPPAKKTAAFDGLAGTLKQLIDAIHARWRAPYVLPPFGPL